MRLLHTGDWHVGRTLRGRSRRAEFEAVLGFLVDLAASEAVDVVVIAGDLYDQRTVSAEADELIFDTLLRLHDAGCAVVALPGNHDSPARLEALAPLLSRVGTTVVSRVARPEAGGVVEVPSRSGQESARVSCLPFISLRHFVDAARVFDDLAAGYNGFDDGVGKLLGAHARSFSPDAVNVVAAHLFVAGSAIAGSEREVTVGADYAVTPQRLPATASYVALGHIHRPQRVPGAACEARYCGSLLQLDFGEAGQAKTVPLVEISPGRPPRVTEIPVEGGKPLIDVTATLEGLPALAGRHQGCYLRVHLEVDGPTPGLADRVREVLPETVDVRLKLPERDPQAPRISVRGLSTREQFVAYHREARGSEPSRELLEAFDRVLAEVEERVP